MDSVIYIFNMAFEIEWCFFFTWTLSERACDSHLVFQVVCEDWRLATSLTPACFSTDDDEDDEDNDEYYVQYKYHLQTVVEAALKNLDGQCVFLTGKLDGIVWMDGIDS